MERVEVVVVGAGITGLSTAWRLAEAGHQVVLLERFELGHDKGSSHGATRIFRFAYADPVYVRLAQAALPLWRELEEASGWEILRLTGGVDLGPASRLDATEGALRSTGAVAERMTPKQIRERFPSVDPGDSEGLFSPDSGVLAAARALEATAALARARGARLMGSTPVRAIRPEGESVTVATDDGDIEARRCVVAAGGWAPDLLEPLGIKLPMRVTREQVLYFKGPDDLPPLIHYGDTDGDRDGSSRFPFARYAVPMYAGAAGIKVGEHMSGEVTTAEGRSYEMDPENAARVARYVEQTFPALDPEPVAFETCLYRTTPDEGFVLDPIGSVIVGSPCSGHGFKFGPLTGEILACLATGREPPADLAPFALTRF